MALSENSTTIVEKQSSLGVPKDIPAAAGAVFFQGAIVVRNSAGFAEPATTATTLTTEGRCRVPADNTGGAAGDITVQVDSGIFGPYVNDDGIAIADTNTLVYLVDDNTVSNDNTGKSVAGSVFGVTPDGVFVAMTNPAAPFGA